MTIPLPPVLYHGSAFLHIELKPGFERSHREVNWDNIESNRFLYASTDFDATVEQGFASAIEKKYGLERYHTDDKSILVKSPYPRLTLEKLQLLRVYVYTIHPKADQGWVKNNNPHNNILTEWKTNGHIRNGLTVEEIDLKKWLPGHTVAIEHFQLPQSRPYYTNW